MTDRAYGYAELAAAADIQPTYLRTLHASAERRRSAGESPHPNDPPAPTWRLRSGPVWVGPAIEAWIAAQVDPQTVSIWTAARVLGSSVDDVRRDLLAGTLKGIRYGSGWRLRRDYVQRVAADRAVVSGF